MVEELRGGIHILGAPFSGSESLVGKLRGRHFFRFRGRLVVFDELRGGTCILGRRFHLFGSSEGGILGLEGARLWLRNSRAIFASWDAVFRFRVFGWEAQRAAFFSGL